jgi:hypothetical protein
MSLCNCTIEFFAKQDPNNNPFFTGSICNTCGKGLGYHRSELVISPPLLSERQLEVLKIEDLYQKFKEFVDFFVVNNMELHEDGSESSNSDVSKGIKHTLRTDYCQICEFLNLPYIGGVNVISRAHILSNKNHQQMYPSIRMEEKTSNYLVLCGTQGVTPSCHHGFDTFKICFVKNPLTPNTWVIITIDDQPYAALNGLEIPITTNPHRGALHGHAIKCMRDNLIPFRKFEKYLDWFKCTPREKYNLARQKLHKYREDDDD